FETGHAFRTTITHPFEVKSIFVRTQFTQIGCCPAANRFDAVAVLAANTTEQPSAFGNGLSVTAIRIVFLPMIVRQLLEPSSMNHVLCLQGVRGILLLILFISIGPD